MTRRSECITAVMVFLSAAFAGEIHADERLDASGAPPASLRSFRRDICDMRCLPTRCDGTRNAVTDRADDPYRAGSGGDVGCHQRPPMTTPSETILRSPTRCSPTTST